MIKLGEKIKLLRKQRNISQEVLANFLGVSFQAVSKWENCSTMPDVMMIPAIASFFGISTDELFDFNHYEIEKNIEAIVEEHNKCWETDKAQAEKIIREGLKKYPGNDVLLNCLIGVLPLPERSDEVIAVAKALVESTKFDEVRFDAYRIMAKAYKSQGEYKLTKEAVEHIPEIYFTKLEIAAQLLEGDEMYEAAQKQKKLSIDTAIDMLIILGKYWKKTGELEKANMQFKIAQEVIDVLKQDFQDPQFFQTSDYDQYAEQKKEIEQLLNE